MPRSRRPGLRWRPISWSRSISARLACRRLMPRATRSSMSPETRCSARSVRPDRSSTGWSAPGAGGPRSTTILLPLTMPRRSRTSSNTCWPPRWPRRTLRSGSIPVSTGPTASPARVRVTTTSTHTPECSLFRPTPTHGQPRTPASSNRSMTIWWAMAVSSTCSLARHASSSTAPAPVPTSPGCAPGANRSLVEARRPA